MKRLTLLIIALALTLTFTACSMPTSSQATPTPSPSTSVALSPTAIATSTVTPMATHTPNAFEVDFSALIKETQDYYLNSNDYDYVSAINVQVDEALKTLMFAVILDDNYAPSDAPDFADELIKQFNTFANEQNSNISESSSSYYGGLYDIYDAAIAVAPESADPDDTTTYWINQVIYAETHVDIVVNTSYIPPYTSTPKPTAKSTPKPTAKPTPKPTVKPTPTPKPASGRYVGSTESDVYHRTSCRWAKEIKKANLITWNSIAAAIADGYRACKVCKP